MLEVYDSSELDALETHLDTERVRLRDTYRIAKEEQRKVIWKNAQFDLKRIDTVEQWVTQVRKDTRRTW